MRTKDFVTFETRLLPNFPGFAIKESLMFFSPVRHILRGFCFESSRFDKKEFYVNRFFMPLFVPHKHVHFTFGARIGQGGWKADEPDLETALSTEMQKEVPYLAGLRTAEDVVSSLERLIKPNPRGYINPHCLEALAFSLLQAGELTRAANALDKILNLVESAVPWQREIAQRAEILKSKLEANPAEAQRQLEIWENETTENLGLGGFA
jgi:hypothetical protein